MSNVETIDEVVRTGNIPHISAQRRRNILINNEATFEDDKHMRCCNLLFYPQQKYYLFCILLFNILLTGKEIVNFQQLLKVSVNIENFRTNELFTRVPHTLG